MKERILSEAEQLFWKYGVRSVTMEDIARGIGISKKTIYQHFSDKEDILYQVVQAKMETDITDIECATLKTDNPIEGMLMVLELMQKDKDLINPNLLIDIKRYYPKAFTLFRKHMDHHLMTSVLENIQNGIMKGLYRNDINPTILARMRVEQIELAFNNDFFPTNQYAMHDIQAELIHHFVRGMLTEKGFTIYNQYINKEKHLQPNE